jgi:hypothetical protein
LRLFTVINLGVVIVLLKGLEHFASNLTLHDRGSYSGIVVAPLLD